MIEKLRRLGLTCLFAAAACGIAFAQQSSSSMAKVKGWAGAASDVPVYSHDGTPRGRQDLRTHPVAGLRQWNPDYNLVKLSGDPGDDRWVPTKHLDLVFCETGAWEPHTPGVGQPQNNRALSYGSGGKC